MTVEVSRKRALASSIERSELQTILFDNPSGYECSKTGERKMRKDNESGSGGPHGAAMGFLVPLLYHFGPRFRSRFLQLNSAGVNIEKPSSEPIEEVCATNMSII